jgi:hypothetical protein
VTRPQLEHIIRAAAGTADVQDIVVIGSQAILGTYPDAPAELTQSMEADVFPKDDPERAIVIDGAIGEESLFHQTFGYYAHGVGESTAILPDGWRDRLVKVQRGTATDAVGWCLDVHDLAVSKLAAGREKDLDFVRALLRSKLARADTIRERLGCVHGLSPELLALATGRLERASTVL